MDDQKDLTAYFNRMEEIEKTRQLLGGGLEPLIAAWIDNETVTENTRTALRIAQISADTYSLMEKAEFLSVEHEGLVDNHTKENIPVDMTKIGLVYYQHPVHGPVSPTYRDIAENEQPLLKSIQAVQITAQEYVYIEGHALQNAVRGADAWNKIGSKGPAYTDGFISAAAAHCRNAAETIGAEGHKTAAQKLTDLADWMDSRCDLMTSLLYTPSQFIHHHIQHEADACQSINQSVGEERCFTDPTYLNNLKKLAALIDSRGHSSRPPALNTTLSSPKA